MFYTRTGSFGKNASGQIVTADGNVVQPGIHRFRTMRETFQSATPEVSRFASMGALCLKSLGR